jgi:ABC-type nitrate/sulfonate/bicarbonate transport system substrate-binding protein
MEGGGTLGYHAIAWKVDDMRLAVPDLVSNSYFPCAAASALGFYKDAGIDLEVVHISPVETCAAALRDGLVDFIGASAHAPLTAFSGWNGVKLLCAQSQGMYWFLVMRRSLGIRRGQIAMLKGRRIAAVPFVAVALRQLLTAAGLDPDREKIEIVSPQSAIRPGTNFGVAAADALEQGTIDGFFANGMGAEIALERGVGDVVIDVRRGDGPKECFDYTLPSVATTDRLIADKPDVAEAVIRTIVRTQQALKADPSLAVKVGQMLFQPFEAGLIGRIIQRDLPYYSPVLSKRFVACMNRYAHDVGLLATSDTPYESVVATRFAALWAKSG